MPLLEARGLVKTYGRRTVVNGVELNVNPGEIVGLLGPNGAGKTTSFRMMVGMITPRSGSVHFNNEEVTHLPMYQRARLGLGYLAQDSSVFRKLSVEQNLWAILELMTVRQGQPYHASYRQKRERVDELLEQFGLTRLRRSNASTLSGGERRRLEIARCLVSEPLLIMLDEPFTGIDPKTVGDIQQIVMSLSRSGIGVLITDHHVAETLRITDRSYLIADGKVICEGSPAEVVNNPIAREKYLGEHFNVAAVAGAAEFAARAAGRTASSSGSTPVGALPEWPMPTGLGPAISVAERPPAAPPETGPAGGATDPNRAALRALLESERMFDLIELLAGDRHVDAVRDLRQAGLPALPALLLGMERADRNIRIRAHRLVADIVGAEIPFNPDADEPTRRRQVAAIRMNLLRRAG